MIKAAVLGSPIGHSLSPALHKRAYEILNVPASFGAIELTVDHAREFFEAALNEDWTGFALTMPLKESILDLNFEVDPIAQRMRSANTLVKVNGNFTATSTDRTGFIRLLSGVEKRRTAIIGGGGTARAALSALDGTAETVDILLRSPHRATLLSTIADKASVNFFDMDHSLRGYDLVISTVPSGASDFIADSLDFTIPTFLEVLYNPNPTALLAKAKSLGSATIDGIDLLVEQALDQVSLFSGKSFDFSEMRLELEAVGRSHLR